MFDQISKEPENHEIKYTRRLLIGKTLQEQANEVMYDAIKTYIDITPDISAETEEKLLDFIKEKLH